MWYGMHWKEGSSLFIFGVDRTNLAKNSLLFGFDMLVSGFGSLFVPLHVTTLNRAMTNTIKSRKPVEALLDLVSEFLGTRCIVPLVTSWKDIKYHYDLARSSCCKISMNGSSTSAAVNFTVNIQPVDQA
jgi:hypothetical protein